LADEPKKVIRLAFWLVVELGFIGFHDNPILEIISASSPVMPFG
jgi:hypothetical protein